MVSIRYVQEEDRNFWLKLDRHLQTTEFEKKIRDKMGYVLLEDHIPYGLLRYNLFWDNTPFCTMLYVDSDTRGRGYGNKLMNFWENDMKSMGYGMLMTSTQVDEDAQYFYRKLGYQDSGGLIINIPGYEQPMEMFLIKKI
ncbi:acetyltransferase (GNAT) family protein [Lacrimispora xylanisolvens]|uniref:Acetyltransferase (GNAT) family protein n=1 Tax=Lacrimispora xylanisolvens TaxID=384636 RepID=A0A2S6HQS7_9FIRM|nr:GNAT family N-acetyltransferase [Hungatella xylanolytica]PPK79958.1 acetyltransferase (GNAT) family protein [Hungatella xylanolytica]